MLSQQTSIIAVGYLFGLKRGILVLLLGSLFKQQIVPIATRSIWLYSYLFTAVFGNGNKHFVGREIWDIKI